MQNLYLRVAPWLVAIAEPLLMSAAAPSILWSQRRRRNQSRSLFGGPAPRQSSSQSLRTQFAENIPE